MHKRRYEKAWENLCRARPATEPHHSEPYTEDELDGVLVRARAEARSVVIYPSDTVAELMERVASILADNRRLRAACEPIAQILAQRRREGHPMVAWNGPPHYDVPITGPQADAILAALAPAVAGGEGT